MTSVNKSGNLSVGQISAKIYFTPKTTIDLDRTIPVFHSWIQEKLLSDMMIDVADYSHVHQGPGIMMICHEGHYSVDFSEGRPGLRYLRRRIFAPNLADTLRLTLHQLAAAAVLLSGPKGLPGVQFDQRQLTIEFLDRLIARDALAVAQQGQSEIQSMLEKITGNPSAVKPHATDPRAPVAWDVSFKTDIDLTRLSQ